MSITKRLFDIVLAGLVLILAIVPMMVIALLVALNSRGPVFYWSDRIGAQNVLFRMPKFRTMKTGVPVIATHLFKDPDRYVTAVGKWLRRTSIDELPQLWNILRGEMSFVGPRPALYNQQDLIALRTQKGVQTLVPGLTGWAQIHGRDDLPIPVKVQYDEYYLKHQSWRLDLQIIWKTIFKIIKGEGVKH